MKNETIAKVETETSIPTPTVKAIDAYFSIEHQGMIAAKYRVKYSQNDQDKHKEAWPEFAGNHFVMYVLSETLDEARKAVFSRDSKIYLSRLIGTMEEFTPTVPGAVLTELQVSCNKTTDLKLQDMYDKITFEDNRTDLLKMYAKSLKLLAKTGKDTDLARAKFYHASATLGITPQSIW